MSKRMTAADFAYEFIDALDSGNTFETLEFLAEMFGLDYHVDQEMANSIDQAKKVLRPLLGVLIKEFYHDWDAQGRKFDIGDVVEISREAFVGTDDVNEFSARGQLGIVSAFDTKERYLVEVDYCGEVGVYEDELSYPIERES